MSINMSDYISPDRSISEMFMLREVNHEATFVFVEGRDDIKLISRMLKPEIYVGFCKGKKKVCELMEKVEHSRLKNVVAIVDKDYDELLNNESTVDGIFYTDGTDMESSILKEDKAINKVLIEYSDEEKVKNYNMDHIPELVSKVYEICGLVGKMRLANQKYDIGLSFKNVSITEYIDQEMNFDFDAFQNAVIKNSDKKSNSDSIKSRIRGELDKNYEFWEICRGHDLVKVMQYVFSSGNECLSYGHENFNEKELSRFIRGAYEEQWFLNSNMYRNLKRWQNQKRVELLNVG